MTGSLWNNVYKERDSHPDMTGKLVIGEKTYSIGAWKNITKNGAEYIKISLSDENSRPSDKPREEKTYHSVGDNFRPKSKHMQDYEREQNAYHKAKQGEDDIPF